MSFEWRVFGVGFASFALLGLFATLAVPALHARLSNRTALAAVRARQLMWLRLMPATLALPASLVIMTSFFLFEPRHAEEEVGYMIPALVGLGLLLTATAAWRGFRMAAATRRLTRTWANPEAITVEIDGRPVTVSAVDAAFPIVAVVGIWRPRLVIARSVLAVCSADELRAMLAHEQGHVARRDNLRRALMCMTPDVLGWLPAAARLFAEWRQAAEEAADDDASRMDVASRLNLASALIKVARLASAPAPDRLVPASAFYCGEHLDRRIRRLLDPADRVEAVTSRSPLRTAIAVTGAVGGSVLAMEGLYSLTEMTIRALP